RAALTSLHANLNLGLLEATVDVAQTTQCGAPASVAFCGSGSLTLPSSSTPLSSLTGSSFTPDFTATISYPLEISASVAPGVHLANLGNAALASATIDICLGGDCTTSSVPLFGTGSGPLSVSVDVKSTDGGGITDLLNSLNPTSASFGNSDPNSILSMLSQVASFFGSIAGQSFMGTQIPFTTTT